MGKLSIESQLFQRFLHWKSASNWRDQRQINYSTDHQIFWRLLPTCFLVKFPIWNYQHKRNRSPALYQWRIGKSILKTGVWPTPPVVISWKPLWEISCQNNLFLTPWKAFLIGPIHPFFFSLPLLTWVVPPSLKSQSCSRSLMFLHQTVHGSLVMLYCASFRCD